jgi:hypothetical protein
MAVLMIIANDRTACVIGFIEAGPLENDARREEDTPDRAIALRTNFQRLVGHFLPDFKTMIAAFTVVFICWHGIYHPYLVVVAHVPGYTTERVMSRFLYS